MTVATNAFPCQRCGMVLFPGNLACPNCGALVHSARLNELAGRAQREEESGNSLSAAMVWRDALPLLPPDSKQYQNVAQRIGMLTSQLAVPPSGPTLAEASDPTAPSKPKPEPKNDPLGLAIAKTVGSMLISIAVYTYLFGQRHGPWYGLKFAVGFCVLMLIHELGHSMAMRYFRLSASPPIFIPFLGAVINLRQMPRNALEEAVVGIAGPVTGTIAAGVTYMLYLQTGSKLTLQLAEFGFLLNLFNMLPVPPLDGGRVTAAVSPWVWIPGLLLVVLWIAADFFLSGQVNFILILLLLMAWPRVQSALVARTRHTPYYDIGRPAKIMMGIAYVTLSGLLAVMFFLCNWEAANRFGGGWFG
jgi:Zn-dependent protease